MMLRINKACGRFTYLDSVAFLSSSVSLYSYIVGFILIYSFWLQSAYDLLDVLFYNIRKINCKRSNKMPVFIPTIYVLEKDSSKCFSFAYQHHLRHLLCTVMFKPSLLIGLFELAVAANKNCPKSSWKIPFSRPYSKESDPMNLECSPEHYFVLQSSRKFLQLN